MSNCLDNLIGIKNVQCEAKSIIGTSDFDLMDAPEISLSKLANIADETYITGMELAKAKLKLAALRLKSDFIGVLQANGMVANINAPTVNLSEYRPSIVIPASTLKRGFSIELPKSKRSRMTSFVVNNIQCYPLTNTTATIYVYDNIEPLQAKTYTATLIGGQINKLSINLTVRGWKVDILTDANVQFASSYLNCSCDGSLPNGYGSIMGWNGTSSQAREGFGLSAEIQIKCDYDVMLCDLQQGYTAELLWIKARVLILEEQLKSNRFNNWIVFGRDETKAELRALQSEYVAKWNDLLGALPNVVSNYCNEECIACRGVKWVTNL